MEDEQEFLGFTILIWLSGFAGDGDILKTALEECALEEHGLGGLFVREIDGLADVAAMIFVGEATIDDHLARDFIVVDAFQQLVHGFGRDAHQAVAGDLVAGQNFSGTLLLAEGDPYRTLDRSAECEAQTAAWAGHGDGRVEGRRLQIVQRQRRGTSFALRIRRGRRDLFNRYQGDGRQLKL